MNDLKINFFITYEDGRVQLIKSMSDSTTDCNTDNILFVSLGVDEIIDYVRRVLNDNKDGFISIVLNNNAAYAVRVRDIKSVNLVITHHQPNDETIEAIKEVEEMEKNN